VAKEKRNPFVRLFRVFQMSPGLRDPQCFCKVEAGGGGGSFCKEVLDMCWGEREHGCLFVHICKIIGAREK